MPDIIQSQYSVDALECIDEIHDTQNKKLNIGMPILQDNLDFYAKLNTEPCQMDTLLSLAVMDARNAQEKKDNMLTEEDFFTNADAMKSLEHIKKRFNI